MASWFGCDPELATSSSEGLDQISGQITPIGQSLSTMEAVGVRQVDSALSDYATAATSFTSDLTTLIGSAAELLGDLGSGTRQVDESLARYPGLT